MSSSSPTTNYSILAIPAYILLTMVPHVASVIVAKNGAALGKGWDNSNPRGQEQQVGIQKRLSPEAFRAYERARACHQNYFESMPIFFSTVILGNMARIPLAGWGGMNWFSGVYLGLRLCHMVLYLNTDSKRFSFARGPAFMGSLGLCAYMIVKASKELVY